MRRAIRRDLRPGTTGTTVATTARFAATAIRTPENNATTATASTPTNATTTARLLPAVTEPSIRLARPAIPTVSRSTLRPLTGRAAREIAGIPAARSAV